MKEEEGRINWQGLGHFFHFFSSYFVSFCRRPDFLAKLDALMEQSENVVVENGNSWLGESPEVNISPKISISAQPLKMALHRNPAMHGSRMVIFLHDSKKALF